MPDAAGRPARPIAARRPASAGGRDRATRPDATTGASATRRTQERPAVRVVGLVKTYAKPGGGQLRAVDDVSFSVRQGEIFGLLGPNGAGKTTTLEIIEGLRKPSAGHVRVLGLDPRRDLKRIKHAIGVQLQADSYFSLLTIQEILELFGSFYPKRVPAEDLLKTAGLWEKRKAYVRQLSGGQQRRFSVAAALVNDPTILFLDEPTTGLDPQARHHLWDLVRRLNRDAGKTIILTTHYMEEAELLADRVAIIDEGRIKAIDTPRALIGRLQGAGRIRFTTTSPVDASELARLSGVARARRRDQGRAGPALTATYELQVKEPRTAAAAVLAWSKRRRVGLRGLEVVPGTLEDVFLRLTGHALRDGGGP